MALQDLQQTGPQPAEPFRYPSLADDQLCINQDDLDERSQQIQIMTHVYSRAEVVVVWLGPDHENLAATANRLIDKIESVWQLELGSTRFPTNQQLGTVGLPHREDPSWHALKHMQTLPYFERVWVIQECRVALKVSMLWGDEEIDWVAFKHTNLWIFLNSAFLPDTLGMRGSPSLKLKQFIWSPDIISIETCPSQSQRWLSLLFATRGYQASDIRDKVYALVGLMGEPEGGLTIRADYRKSPPEVFSELVTQIIPRTQDLKVLSYVMLDTLDYRPLWAPIWAMNDAVVKCLDDHEFRASGTMAARFKATPGWEVLALEGLMLEDVKFTSKILTEDTSENSTTIEDAWGLVTDWQLRVENRTGDSQSLIRPFVWTITAGQTAGPNFSTSIAADEHFLDFIANEMNSLLVGIENMAMERAEMRCLRRHLGCAAEALNAYQHLSDASNLSSRQLPEVFKDWFEMQMRTAHPRNGEIAQSATDTFERLWKAGGNGIRYQEVMMQGGLERKLFMTKQGHMGIGPRVMEPGDKVCVLFGGKTPYIVRPTLNPDEYLFLGDCYVHGFMDGEAIEGWERGEIGSQWFHLR
jgi:hypothetical protein